MNPIATDIEQAREQLVEILSQPEFGRKERQGELSAFDWQPDFPDWLRWLTELPPEMFWGIYIGLGVFAAVILFWVIRVWPIGRPRNISSKHMQEGRLPLFVQAQAAAEQGQYRLAIRLLFHYLLEFTSQQRKIFLQTGKTNGDYQREIKKTWPDKEKMFAQLTNHFDEVWYGRKQAGDQEYSCYKQKVMQLAGEGEQHET
ncbi:DUF4129 domain-containing protein [Lihuaxuella thermophila]|uniref:Protein-glutamine gamma-glutamyltransferase-like C-terminal domain-containing protein n=1 Tax=Lihuaxuella thermophila TaxID=1173111 RepID=A0A1H8FJ38_9BACL|nr:DUF4129 domain-containing protein [Lihuaxuella thermophila]SEN31645.1 protein of unknown function [Lihuaxuella thermophila]